VEDQEDDHNREFVLGGAMKDFELLVTEEQKKAVRGDRWLDCPRNRFVEIVKTMPEEEFEKLDYGNDGDAITLFGGRVRFEFENHIGRLVRVVLSEKQ
jgi:hypothetical protein